MQPHLLTGFLSGALGVGLVAFAPSLNAQATRFFKIASLSETEILDLDADGFLSWSNAVTGGTCIIQVSPDLAAPSSWVDYVQVQAETSVTKVRLFDPNPPPGMVLIPMGSFTMGDTFGEGDIDEWPAHIVFVSAFYMDRTEVTKTLFDEVKSWNGGNGYSYDIAEFAIAKAPTHPVLELSWYDSLKWCNARSQKEGLEPCYYADVGMTIVYKVGTGLPYVKWDASGYRLPTEAEWEKAARGGRSGKRFGCTDTDTLEHAWANYSSVNNYVYDLSETTGYHPSFYDGIDPFTSPVGYFTVNGYGLSDVVGNASEWCWDWYSSKYYSSSPETDPRGPTSGRYRINRGGNWHDDAFRCRTAYRTGLGPDIGSNGVGFRSVRVASQPQYVQQL